LISQKSQHYYLYLWPPATIAFPQNMREPGNPRNTKSWTCGRLLPSRLLPSRAANRDARQWRLFRNASQTKQHTRAGVTASHIIKHQ
jgi:hypothetical protein